MQMSEQGYLKTPLWLKQAPNDGLCAGMRRKGSVKAVLIYELGMLLLDTDGWERVGAVKLQPRREAKQPDEPKYWSRN